MIETIQDLKRLVETMIYYDDYSYFNRIKECYTRNLLTLNHKDCLMKEVVTNCDNCIYSHKYSMMFKFD